MPNMLPQQPMPVALPRSRHVSVISILLTIVLTIVVIILGERILYDINRALNPLYGEGGKDYQTYRLLLHTAIIVPIFLLSFLFYYFLKFKRQSSPYQIISWAYLIFAFVMVMHLLGELGLYMIRHYQTFGVYLVLGILVAVFTTLIIIIQKKLHARA